MERDISLSALLRFMGRDLPESEAVANLCKTCGGTNQVDLETRLCSTCRNPHQENAEIKGIKQEKAVSDAEFNKDDVKTIDDIMKVDFDALIKGKSEEELTQIRTLLTNHFKHEEFKPKAANLLKAFEEIWAAEMKEFEKKKGGKCMKCKENNPEGTNSRCHKCFQRVVRLRKRLDPNSYKECSDCHEVRFLSVERRCEGCYRKNLEKRKLEQKQKSAEKANKRASSPIKRPTRNTVTSIRPRSSQFFKDDQQSINKQELKQKFPKDVSQSSETPKRPKVQNLVEKQAVEPTSIPREIPQMIKCFGCFKLFNREDSSPKERVCMKCFTISLVVNSRPDLPI